MTFSYHAHTRVLSPPSSSGASAIPLPHRPIYSVTLIYLPRVSTDRHIYLRTGDLGRIDEAGKIFIAGRMKDLIIVRGKNLYPQVNDNCYVERLYVALLGNPLHALGDGSFLFAAYMTKVLRSNKLVSRSYSCEHFARTVRSLFRIGACHISSLLSRRWLSSTKGNLIRTVVKPPLALRAF